LPTWPKRHRVEEKDQARFHSLKCDLADHATIREFPAAVSAVSESVDGLILNAGIMHTPKRGESKDGVEMQMAANVVGHHLLTSLLTGHLKAASGKAIVVSTASVLAKEAKPATFDDLNSAKDPYDTHAVYAATKAGAIMWRDAFRRRVKEAGQSDKIIVHTSHPGVAYTSLINTSVGPVARFILSPIVWAVLASANTAAIPSLRAVLDKDLADGSFVGPLNRRGWSGPTGVYDDYNPDVTHNEELQEKLWAFCEEKTGAKWAL